MHPDEPRIPPLDPADFTDEQRELIGDWTAMSFTRVIVTHPDLYRVLLPLISKLIPGSSLPPRDREILVLRTLALCDEVYELTHHVEIARSAGMSDAEIENARAGSAEPASFDHALVRAAEELLRDRRVSDATWAELAKRYSPVQLMEVVALVGGYTLMAMVTRSYGIPLEDSEVFESFRQKREYT